METLFVVSYLTLWALVLSLAAVTVALTRQIGLLHKRVEPTGARTEVAGPPIGEQVHDVTAVALSGHSIKLVSPRHQMSMVVFVAPGCPACEDLMPAVRSLIRNESGLSVVVVSLSEDQQANAAMVKTHRIDPSTYVASPELATVLRVAHPPYAVLLASDRTVIAKGVVNHLEHLGSLLSAARVGHPTMESYLGLHTSIEGGRPSVRRREAPPEMTGAL